MNAEGVPVEGQAAEQVPAPEIAKLEEAQAERLPESREDAAPVERAEHPSGETFFTGEAGNLSDAEAEEVARQQLMRSGLLRGQRVRVAD